MNDNIGSCTLSCPHCQYLLDMKDTGDTEDSLVACPKCNRLTIVNIADKIWRDINEDEVSRLRADGRFNGYLDAREKEKSTLN